jgi:hypothetical protein
MKSIHAYLAGTLMLAAVLGSSSAFAQTDTTRRDTSRLNRTADNTARSNEKTYTFIDLNSGDTLDYWYDTDKKAIMNRATNMPVEFYINTYTGDTVYGRGRFVVNGLLVQDANGKWKFDENKVKIDGDELKIKDGKRKLKIDGEDIKIKDGKNKIKGDEKEAKIKDGDIKAKSNDEKLKVKDEQGKAKYDKEGTKIKEKKKADTLRIQQ